MATISLQISDAALVVVTDYAASLSTTPEVLIASQGVANAVRTAYADGVRKLTESRALPASVQARIALSFGAAWTVLSAELDRTGDVDADIAKAVAGE